MKTYINLKTILSNEHTNASLKSIGPFTIVLFKNTPLHVNFWKVHISSTFEQYKTVLNVVVHILLKFRINFKFLNNPQDVIKLLGEKAPQSQIGKLITIYPYSVTEMKKLMRILYLALRDASGPEILTDREYKDSTTIFYRFGQIKLTTDNIIYGPNGKKFKDDRKPYFHLPDWIEDPFQRHQQATGYKLQKHYNVIGILKKDNLGNVYLGSTKGNKKIVIKQARKGMYSVYDGKEKARYREFQISKEFQDKGFQQGLRPVDVINEKFSTFYIYKFQNSGSLKEYTAQHGPLVCNNKIKSILNIFRMTLSLLITVHELHQLGYENIDISNTNLS